MGFFRIQGALLMFVIMKITFCASEESCKKIDRCSCRLSNGSVVSLKAVDGGWKPSFTGIGGTPWLGSTYDWNPCTQFTANVPSMFRTCIDVMVCNVDAFGGVPCGSKDTSFSMDSSGNVVISYGFMRGPDGDASVQH